MYLSCNLGLLATYPVESTGASPNASLSGIQHLKKLPIYANLFIYPGICFPVNLTAKSSAK